MVASLYINKSWLLTNCHPRFTWENNKPLVPVGFSCLHYSCVKLREFYPIFRYNSYSETEYVWIFWWSFTLLWQFGFVHLHRFSGMWDKRISLIWMVDTWNGYLIVAEAQVVKRAHFNGQEARQVSLSWWWAELIFLFFLMYKMCARALNIFIVIPKMHAFLLHREILASVQARVPTRWQILFTENRGKNSLRTKWT